MTIDLHARSFPFNRHERRKRERLARPSSCHRKRHQAAAYRAICAAKFLLDGLDLTLQDAALMFASTPQYIAAAIVVLQAEDQQLLKRVLTGDISLLKAAADVKTRAALFAAYRAASRADRLAVVDEILGSTPVPDQPAGPAVDGDAGEDEESIEELLDAARISGDVASYLQKRGLTTLGDAVESS
jgi:hypothetical protein